MPRRNVTKDEEKILEAARRIAEASGAGWPLRILEAAARAAEWYVKVRPGLSAPPRHLSAKVIDDELYGGAAPADVNPLLLPFVLADVERARAGEDLSLMTRPRLRKLLASAVPEGRHGQARSFLPEKVTKAKAAGWSDEMIMEHLKVASPGAIRVLLSQARKRGVKP